MGDALTNVTSNTLANGTVVSNALVNGMTKVGATRLSVQKQTASASRQESEEL